MEDATRPPGTRGTPLDLVLARFGVSARPAGTRAAAGDSPPRGEPTAVPGANHDPDSNVPGGHPGPVLGAAGCGSDPGAGTGSRPLAAWDAGVAGRLLDDLRRAIRDAEVREFGGHLPDPVARVLGVWVEVGEGYVRDQARLRAAGWDPLGWLRSLPSVVPETVANWQQSRPGVLRRVGKGDR